MSLTNHIANANHAAASYLAGDTSESAKLARANLKVSMLEGGIRELQHLLAGPDPRGLLVALPCKVWGVEVTLHVQHDEDGLAWQEAWISSTRVDDWLLAIPEDAVDDAMHAAWAEREREATNDYGAELGEERRAAA